MASICCSPPLSVPPRWRCALSEHRKERVAAIQVRLNLRARSLLICAQQQIFAHAQVGENLPALRHVADAKPHDFMWRQRHEVPRLRRVPVVVIPPHFTGGGTEQPADRSEKRGFAGPVGADEGNDLAAIDVQRDAVQRLDAPYATWRLSMERSTARRIAGNPNDETCGSKFE